MFNDKTLLVTGGTGTFGKAFISHVLRNFPKVKKIIVFSRDEFKQFEMAHSPEFEQEERLRFFVGDVRDYRRLRRAFEEVDLVIHAAALKQIPSCEYNPFEAIKTNVLGAQNVVEAALDCNVQRVVALSTDKACSPINLYGATKLCSDKLFIAANVYSGRRKTQFSVVRYGNVMGSRGSVIPYFQGLAINGAKAIPITDKRMTRFWLRIEHAVGVVIQALEVMQGGELFVLKLPSIKIVDLAQAIAPHLDAEMVGIRPGEKIHEMMISQDDARNTLEYNHYYVIRPQYDSWQPQLNGETGKPVTEDFEYHSGNNPQWLRVEDIRSLISQMYPHPEASLTAEYLNGKYTLKQRATMPMVDDEDQSGHTLDKSFHTKGVTVNIYQAK